jgi:hypothetical protein
MGALLIGTHAFVVLGNLLGVKWLHSALQTQNVDIAGERGVTAKQRKRRTWLRPRSSFRP